MNEYINTDGKFKDLWEIEEMWNKLGITRDKKLIFYCGTGWRSSVAFFYAYLLGWKEFSNFDGSWYEWSMGSQSYKNPCDNPFTT